MHPVSLYTALLRLRGPWLVTDVLADRQRRAVLVRIESSPSRMACPVCCRSAQCTGGEWREFAATDSATWSTVLAVRGRRWSCSDHGSFDTPFESHALLASQQALPFVRPKQLDVLSNAQRLFAELLGLGREWCVESLDCRSARDVRLKLALRSGRASCPECGRRCAVFAAGSKRAWVTQMLGLPLRVEAEVPAFDCPRHGRTHLQLPFANDAALEAVVEEGERRRRGARASVGSMLIALYVLQCLVVLLLWWIPIESDRRSANSGFVVCRDCLPSALVPVVGLMTLSDRVRLYYIDSDGAAHFVTRDERLDLDPADYHAEPAGYLVRIFRRGSLNTKPLLEVERGFGNGMPRAAQLRDYFD